MLYQVYVSDDIQCLFVEVTAEVLHYGWDMIEWHVGRRTSAARISAIPFMKLRYEMMWNVEKHDLSVEVVEA